MGAENGVSSVGFGGQRKIVQLGGDALGPFIPGTEKDSDSQ